MSKYISSKYTICIAISSVILGIIVLVVYNSNKTDDNTTNDNTIDNSQIPSNKSNLLHRITLDGTSWTNKSIEDEDLMVKAVRSTYGVAHLYMIDEVLRSLPNDSNNTNFKKITDLDLEQFREWTIHANTKSISNTMVDKIRYLPVHIVNDIVTVM